MRQHTTSIVDACLDPELFGRWLRDIETWRPWLAFLAALFGLPMSAEQRKLYTECTGRTEPPSEPINEVWAICGRRAGKSFALALIAVYLACFRSYAQFLGPGERGTILVLATDRRQSRIIFRYVRALILQTPLLAPKVQRETADTIDLDGSVSIEIATASYKTTRGYTLLAVLADEVARWPTDNSSEPDYEILDAVRPGMATIPGAMLLCASSPHRKRGAMHDAFVQFYGRDDPGVLVWKAPTRVMNATVPQDVIDRAMVRDPSWANAEYGAEFRDDVEGFVTWDVVRACIEPGVRERPPEPQISYCAFVDPSGGSSDSMTVAIAHRAGGDVVIDALREVVPPFSPDSVCREFASLLKSYRVSSVTGDRYGGMWPAERFGAHGISYKAAELAKSALYVELLPRLNAGTIKLLDNVKLVSQLTGLERRHATVKDVIDHAPNSHDDLSNVVAGVLVSLGSDASASYRRFLDLVSDRNDRGARYTIGHHIAMTLRRPF